MPLSEAVLSRPEDDEKAQDHNQNDFRWASPWTSAKVMQAVSIGHRASSRRRFGMIIRYPDVSA
jgi:hypothetical protein